MKTVIDAVNEFKGEWPYDEPLVVEQIKKALLRIAQTLSY